MKLDSGQPPRFAGQTERECLKRSLSQRDKETICRPCPHARYSSFESDET